MTVLTAVATATLLPTGGLTAGWAMACCRLRRLHHEVHVLREQASDSVTGGPTRAGWESSACARLAAPEPTVVLIADLDRFKQVNDEWGHLAGDVVLRIMAERLTAAFAASQGEVCRLGGDEFGVVATDTSLVDDVAALSESLGAPITLPTGRRVTVGVSVGVSRTNQQEAPALTHALAKADEQLLAAKRCRHGAAARR